MSTQWYEAQALDARIASLLTPTETVLDIGCGLRPQSFFEPRLHLCIEPFDQYANLIRRFYRQKGNLFVLQGRVREALSLLPDQSVDSSFLIDVIEHLPKEDGQWVIAQLERVTRKQIAIFTPLGFMPQHYTAGDKDLWGLDGTSFQEHLSGWTPEDFGESWTFHGCKNYHPGETANTHYGAFWALKTLREARPALAHHPLIFWQLPTDQDSALAEKISSYDPTSYALASLSTLVSALPVLTASAQSAATVHPFIAPLPQGIAAKMCFFYQQTLALIHLLRREKHGAIWLWSASRFYRLVARIAGAVVRVPVQSPKDILP
jgi:hypothetical protein